MESPPHVWGTGTPMAAARSSEVLPGGDKCRINDQTHDMHVKCFATPDCAKPQGIKLFMLFANLLVILGNERLADRTNAHVSLLFPQKVGDQHASWPSHVVRIAMRS